MEVSHTSNSKRNELKLIIIKVIGWLMDGLFLVLYILKVHLLVISKRILLTIVYAETTLAPINGTVKDSYCHGLTADQWIAWIKDFVGEYYTLNPQK
jgi:hypothetical protein